MRFVTPVALALTLAMAGGAVSAPAFAAKKEEKKAVWFSSCYALSRSRNSYAHIEVLVTFLVVRIFSFFVITRDHGSYEGRH